MNLQRFLCLYLAFPILLAFLNGVRGTVYAPEMGAFDTVIMFVVCGLPTYGFAAAVAHLVLPFVPLARLSGLAALVLSAIAAIPFSYFVIVAYIILLDGVYPSFSALINEQGTGLADGFFGYVLGSSGLLIVPLWVGAHFLYEKMTRDSLFFPDANGHLKASEGVGVLRRPVRPADSPAEVLEASDNLPFLEKLKPELGRRVLAMEAQEHYVKVYTDRGDGLVLYRFGDAVREITPCCPGMQVHRSYWVAVGAVSEVQSEKKSVRLKLSNGLEVPVSNSYRKLVEEYLQVKPDLHVQR